MERGIDPRAQLDYVEFQMFPTQNRYEAYVQSNSKVEKIASGPLEQLLLHSPKVKELCSKGSNAKFRIQPPDSRSGAEWFTTSTLTRFLHIVGSPDILNITNEVSQLEETRNFQVSLSAKQTGRDGAPSDGSKNELLQAMDLRLTALKDEFTTAFNRATGAICSSNDIYQLEKFSHLFGAEDIRNSFCNFVEVAPEDLTVDVQCDSKLKYGISPGKVAQVERQSSTGSEASSLSSEEDQPSIGRSRTLLRPASPIRSASPMRHVQIRRSVSQRDVTSNSSEDEGIEQPPKNNVLRMSVQDKISLFENKQKDQTEDVQKTNATVVANKAVLRRWSSGMGENSVQGLPDIVSKSSEPPVGPTNVASEVNMESALKVEAESSLKFNPVESVEKHVKPVLFEQRIDICEVDSNGSNEVNPASAEWSRQKEAELNQLFMKMRETKPVRQQNDVGTNNKTKNSPSEQRGGFYDHYKQKRDEKLRGEAAGKRAEKEAQFKVIQQFLDERKAEMASTNISEVGRRNTVKKTQKMVKNSSQISSSKKENTKPSSVAKKTTTKTSPLPTTRKSWPSTPSPRTAGPPPAKTPTGLTSAGTTPTRRKPKSASSIPPSSPNVEKPLPQPKILKATRDDFSKSETLMNEKKKQTITKNGKTTKTKVQTTTERDPTLNAKPSFYNKVTRKGSVVPLESKPFLRKGTGVGPGVGPVIVKTKALPSEESLRNSGDLIQAEENYLVNNSSDLIIENQERDREAPAPENCHNLQSETQITSPEKCEEPETPDQVIKHIEISQNNMNNEEIEISPTAWVEIEEHQYEIVPCKDSPIQMVDPANVAYVGISITSPRVRHSLSQMLLEESSSEADVLEWGNAENPPAMVYQKDAPKGLKRLLKFARKSIGDSHLSDFSSPSAFSEGEDDVEENKGSKRNSDHTLRKSSLHASNYGQTKFTSNEAYEKNSDKSHISKFSAQNHQKMQEGQNAASGTTTKATRPFFSLSAFRGSKPNEARLPCR